MHNRIAPKLVAEFIGTFALVFIGAGTAAVLGDGAGLNGIAAIAFAHGLTIMVFAFAYGSLSGGHMNPAVTVGVLAAGGTRLIALRSAGFNNVDLASAEKLRPTPPRPLPSMRLL